MIPPLFVKQAMDPGGNGEVEWRWFLAATMRSSKKALENSQPTLIDAFLLLDRDHDGFVTVEDLEAIFHNSPSSSLQALDRAHILAMMQRATPKGSVSKVCTLFASASCRLQSLILWKWLVMAGRESFDPGFSTNYVITRWRVVFSRTFGSLGTTCQRNIWTGNSIEG